MADDPNGKTPESIKKHQSRQTFEMRTPDGSRVRQDEAAKRVEAERQTENGNRAAKYANVEKAKLVSQKDMEAGTKGRLSGEMNKEAKNKDMDR